MVNIFGISKDEAKAVKETVRHTDKDPERQAGGKKAAETSNMRDTRADNTPDAKRTKSAKVRAAKRQFAKADEKNDPATEEAPSSKQVAAEADKVRAMAERERVAAKREAMKPATPEAIEAARMSIAVKGW